MRPDSDYPLPELLTELSAMGVCIGQEENAKKITDFMLLALDNVEGYFLAQSSIIAGNGKPELAHQILLNMLNDPHFTESHDYINSVTALIESLSDQENSARQRYGEILAYSSDAKARELANNGLSILDAKN